MGEECACRKWKEDVYWNNFHCLQFFQTLSGHFHQHLAIPKKFAQNMSEALSETIVLKSPTGASWTVGLSARGDTLFLEKGWKEFIEDNSLVEDDVLLFKYNRGSHFEIQMFDGQSLCEKEASYFVGKCDHSELENTGGSQGNCTSLVITGELTEHTTSEAWTLPSARSQLQPGRKIQKPATSIREMSRMITGYPVIYQSRRRSVTEDEKRNALELANAALNATESSCIVVMRSSHVYKGFYLSIPTGWAANHLPGVSRVVVLCVPNDTRRWTTKYQNKGRGCGLTGGWKKFARENFLEESDVCLFKIASETNNDSIVMDVTIFRVVAEVIAATRLA